MLTPAAKAKAKQRAKAAGRSYPNLVDNMQAARQQKAAGKGKAGTASKTSAASKPRASAKAGAVSKTRPAAKTRPVAKRAARSADGAKHRSKAPGAKSPARDPHGGLTAAGRAEFRRRDGAHLKPGVKKQRIADMTPQELRRKGSWATRFFGRDPLPALRDAQGKPTRFALSAHAWGEPVPSTEAAARRIAAKGRRLLERYRRLRSA